jgi:hypothetical protein
MEEQMQHCCEINDSQVLASPAYRKVLWTALLLNALMFGVEIVGGIAASSTSLLADSLDFLGDATNYGISIFVLGMSLRVRARASLIKALTMALFGMFVLGKALYGFFVSVTPEPYTMGAIAILALLVNVLVALLLYRYRNGDSNMRLDMQPQRRAGKCRRHVRRQRRAGHPSRLSRPAGRCAHGHVGDLGRFADSRTRQDRSKGRAVTRRVLFYDCWRFTRRRCLCAICFSFFP